MKPMRHAAAAALAALLASCNGGGNGESPPLLGATPGAGATIYAFGGTGSPNEDGAEPKGTLTAVTIGGATVLFGRTAIGGKGKGAARSSRSLPTARTTTCSTASKARTAATRGTTR